MAVTGPVKGLWLSVPDEGEVGDWMGTSRLSRDGGREGQLGFPSLREKRSIVLKSLIAWFHSSPTYLPSFTEERRRADIPLRMV